MQWWYSELSGESPDTGSTISGNTAFNNVGSGIRSESASTLSGNTAYINGSDGIRAFKGSTVQSNSVRANGRCRTERRYVSTGTSCSSVKVRSAS